MLPQFGQIERRAVGPHGASRIKMEGSEKASLRNLRFLLAQHPVGVRVLQAAREAAVGDTRTPSPNPNPNANPNPSPSRSPIPSPSPSPSPIPSPNPNQDNDAALLALLLPSRPCLTALDLASNRLELPLYP